ncbi:hypothetical protein SLEP1_g25000 [Rubroshorea leprosula]|uniref:Uncharacterized protein n=1 Tax=Rubroshorea leprosula TaxID=152421 RepID=A0AAV5JHD2_9ROSI|nr:hypothetical protein SLEP1_g25000 [Rubroshorea leprosula]
MGAISDGRELGSGNSGQLGCKKFRRKTEEPVGGTVAITAAKRGTGARLEHDRKKCTGDGAGRQETMLAAQK